MAMDTGGEDHRPRDRQDSDRLNDRNGGHGQRPQVQTGSGENAEQAEQPLGDKEQFQHPRQGETVGGCRGVWVERGLHTEVLQGSSTGEQEGGDHLQRDGKGNAHARHLSLVGKNCKGHPSG